MQYIIDLKYQATIRVAVEADDVGIAFGKARAMAEDADPAEFNLGEEESAVVVKSI